MSIRIYSPHAAINGFAKCSILIQTMLEVSGSVI